LLRAAQVCGMSQPFQPAADPAADDAGKAAAYDAWFRAEVEAAIRDADDPNCEWISHEEVLRRSRERQAKRKADAA
jgi:hypothetical protein